MKKFLTLFLLAIVLQFISYPLNSTVIYVRASATGANNGTNWTDAFTSLQSGIGATIPGDTIWVAQGVYKPTTTTTRTISFALPDGVKIFGGFNGTETNFSQRNFNLYVANLSGDIGVTGNSSDNSYHVVTTASVSSSAELDGVRILSGNANGGSWSDYGGGIYNNGGSPIIRNCTIQNNVALHGGGITQNAGNMSLINCSVIYNTANYVVTVDGGGGLLVWSGIVSCYGCRFSFNTANSGGAILMEGGTLNLDRCDLSGNTATYTGGALYGYQNDFYVTIANSLIVGNYAANSGASAMYLASSPAHQMKLLNCTVAHNRAPSSSTASVILGNTSVVHNSLFFGNSDAAQVVGATASNCLIQSIIVTDLYFVSPGTASMAPFAATSYDYHVAAFSPAVNYGSSTLLIPAYNLDLDNAPRTQGPNPDAGCYENPACTFNLSITSSDSTAICSGSSSTLNASSGNAFLWGDNSTGSSISVDSAGTYTLQADSAGCLGTASYQLSIIDPALTVSGPPGICPGDSAMLTANGNSISTYAWSNGDTTNSIIISSGGTYSVSVTTSAGCTDTYTFTVTAYTAPNPVITFSNPVFSTSTTFSSYQWLINGVPIGGATSQQYTATQNGDYSVIVTNSQGCTDTSAVYTLLNLGINGTGENEFVVFPNPNSGVFTIRVKAEFNLSIYNATGECIIYVPSIRESTQVDLTDQPAGLYLLKLEGYDGTYLDKLIIQ